MTDTKPPPSLGAPVRRRSLVRALVIAGVTVVIAALSAALLVNVVARKEEAKNPFFRVVELDDDTEDPAVWGRNFPQHYDAYRRTVDQTRTRFGGSEALPRTPTEADPRVVVSQSRIEEDSRLKTLWAGYAFAVDFREERGHAFMLEDQTFTERQRVAKQPGTCLHCHASVYVPYKKLGNGDVMAGFAAMNQKPYAEARKLVTHPVTCIDCHDATTLRLRVTRPAFIEGIRAYEALQGKTDFDVNRDATHQQMRSYVCGQCHVEYYFQGKEKRLVYPWKKGLRVEDIYAYYAERGFSDWTHAKTGGGVLKAQHPEFELWSQGVHARSGVACADCHMPYQRQGAHKVTDHHVRSPMLMVDRACQVCHRWPEDELRARVERIQETSHELRGRALDAVVALIGDFDGPAGRSAPEAALAEAREHHRKATFFVDFVEAENSTGFHAPQEAARILAVAIDHARRGQLALRAAAPMDGGSNDRDAGPSTSP